VPRGAQPLGIGVRGHTHGARGPPPLVQAGDEVAALVRSSKVVRMPLQGLSQ